MAMNNVEWTLENIKKAEKACEEAQQMVIIKTIDVSVPGDTTLPGLGMEGSGRVLDEAGKEKNEGYECQWQERWVKKGEAEGAESADAAVGVDGSLPVSL